MRLPGVALAAALIVAIPAGCGGSAGDLLAIEVSGGFQGREVRLTVTSDGRGRCNDGELRALASELVIEARELERDLGGLAEDGASFEEPGADRRQFVARTRAGTVRWTEGASELPSVLPRAVLIERQLEQQLC